MYVAPGLVQPTASIERGEPRPVIDTVGWVFGIPSRILLWNWKVENHNISPETESYISNYLELNQLGHVKVRVNQYRPMDDWKRLRTNTAVAWPWRYTFGTFATLGETLFPGRIFGGDHYNPYTATVHLYSDLPSIALHEAAHAKDFSRRKYQGTYAAIYNIPGVSLYHEDLATSDVFAYLEDLEDDRIRDQAYKVLYPAYGTYVGGAFGSLVPSQSTPFYFAGVLGGHIIGRSEARNNLSWIRSQEVYSEMSPNLADP